MVVPACGHDKGVRQERRRAAAEGQAAAAARLGAERPRTRARSRRHPDLLRARGGGGEGGPPTRSRPQRQRGLRERRSCHVKWLLPTRRIVFPARTECAIAHGTLCRPGLYSVWASSNCIPSRCHHNYCPTALWHSVLSFALACSSCIPDLPITSLLAIIALLSCHPSLGPTFGRQLHATYTPSPSKQSDAR